MARSVLSVTLWRGPLSRHRLRCLPVADRTPSIHRRDHTQAARQQASACWSLSFTHPIGCASSRPPGSDRPALLPRASALVISFIPPSSFPVFLRLSRAASSAICLTSAWSP